MGDGEVRIGVRQVAPEHDDFITIWWFGISQESNQ